MNTGEVISAGLALLISALTLLVYKARKTEEKEQPKAGVFGGWERDLLEKIISGQAQILVLQKEQFEELLQSSKQIVVLISQEAIRAAEERGRQQGREERRR